MIDRIIGIVGTLVGIMGIFVAFVLYKRGIKEKSLIFDSLLSRGLARITSGTTGYSVTLLYNRTGNASEQVDGVWITLLRLKNVGKAAIVQADIAQGDPLRIMVKAERVLEAKLSSESRSACRVAVGPLTPVAGHVEIPLTFDLLDQDDGAVVEVVTTIANPKLELVGTIAGMRSGPRGVPNTEVFDASNRVWLWLAGVLVVSLIVSACAFRFIIGTWYGSYVLILPVALFIGLGLILGQISISRRKSRSAPLQLLTPPEWYGSRFGS